jgi:hypothetical protein
MQYRGKHICYVKNMPGACGGRMTGAIMPGFGGEALWRVDLRGIGRTIAEGVSRDVLNDPVVIEA